MEAGKDLQPLPLNDDEHKTYIGLSLNPDDRRLVSRTLMDNTDLFPWTTTDIPGVSANIITHRLSIYKEARPVTQKTKTQGREVMAFSWSSSWMFVEDGAEA